MGNTTTVSLLVAVGYHLPTMIALAIALAMLVGGPRSRPRSVAMAGLAILMLCTALDAVMTVLPVLFVGAGRMEMLRTLNSAVLGVQHAPADYPSGRQGQVLTVSFTVAGVPCLGLNGGPAFRHSEAFSFQIATDDQAETDRLWHAIIDHGGEASACGWCKDRWGLSWQITPRALIDAITDPDPAAARRAFEAMMGMTRIDIAAIEAARRG